jgi:hypothetical protein
MCFGDFWSKTLWPINNLDNPSTFDLNDAVIAVSAKDFDGQMSGVQTSVTQMSLGQMPVS